jgi:DNA-binding CsgD family transcriptional regulator
MFNVMDFVERSRDFSLNESADYLLDHLEKMGFVNCSFGVLPAARNFKGQSIPLWYKSSCEPAFVSYYLRHLMKNDPVLWHCYRRSNVPLFWGDSVQFEALQRQVVETMHSYGLQNGVCLSFHTPNTATAFNICFNGTPREHSKYFHEVSNQVFAVGLAFNYLLEQHRVVESIYESVGLSARQIELLKWVGSNAPDKIIADKMMLSIDGLYHHKREIKRKLGVRYLNQAAIVGF